VNLPVPGFMMTVGVRDANAYRDLSGAVVMGQQGQPAAGQQPGGFRNAWRSLNQIPRFMGHPTGGVVYSNTPSAPWIPNPPGSAGAAGADGARLKAAVAPAGGGAAGAESMEDRCSTPTNARGQCIKSRNKPFCDLEGGHRTAVICNLGNISLRLGRTDHSMGSRQGSVVGDKEAAAMCVRPYRAPWDGVLRSVLKV